MSLARKNSGAAYPSVAINAKIEVLIVAKRAV
jgi:hypothetical protein